MLWIVLTFTPAILVAVLLKIGGAVGRANAKNDYHQNEISHWWFSGVAAVLGLIWFILTLIAIVHTVENGHVGLVYTFGQITGQRGNGQGGLVLTYPWQSIEEANVQVQALHPLTDCYGGRFKACMEAFTSETQDVFIIATINVRVDPRDIQALYRTVGPDYVNKLVLPRVAQVTKEEAVKYSADKIAPSREELRKTIANRLTTELSTRSIAVDDFLVTNVDFRDEFKAAIEAKVKAEQDAQAEKNKVAISQAQAEQVAATARGAADKLRIEAEGQAAANIVVAASLTPELIQFQTIQKLAGNISVIGIPISQGTIFDLGSLMTPRTTTDAPAAPSAPTR